MGPKSMALEKVTVKMYTNSSIYWLVYLWKNSPGQ